MAKYQSQFVPTDFNTYGNILQMFRQDMGQRNQEFDQGVMMKNQTLEELYGTKTYDQDVINEQTDRLKKQIDEAVKRKGMDYGAAASDIMNLIAQEKSNPIWGLNAQKVERTKALQDMLDRNPSLKVFKDPRNVALSAKNKPEDFNYDVLDPEEANKRFIQMYGNLAKQTKHAGVSRENGYEFLNTQLGLSDAEADAMKNDPTKFAGFLNSMGQLEAYKNNPEVINEMKGLYSEYVDSLKGGIHKTVGMTPAQIEDRAARREEREFNKFLKLEQLDIAQQRANKYTGRGNLMSGISGYIPVPVKPPFDKSKEIFEEITSNVETDKKNKAGEVLSRVITPQWIDKNLTSEQRKLYGNNAEEIIKNIDKKYDEFINRGNIPNLPEGADIINPAAAGTSLLIDAANLVPKLWNWGASKDKLWQTKEIKEIDNIRKKLGNELDVYLKSQGDDAQTPFVGISQEDWDYINSSKGIKNEIRPEQMIFESGTLEGKLGEELQKDGDFKDLLKNGFDIHNVYGTEGGAKFEIRDKSTGTPYIVSLPPTIATKITGMVSPAIQEMEILKDFKFVGNKLKVGNQEKQLPFTVSSQWKNTKDGRKFVYTIPQINHEQYIEKEIDKRKSMYEPLRYKLKMLGLSDEEIESQISNEITESIYSDFDIRSMTEKEFSDFLKSPFETELKSEIMNLAGIK